MINKVAGRRQWWWSKRLKYNIGLIISGFVAFMLYCLLGEAIIAPKGEFEVTLFTIFFQGCAYMIMIFIANILYTLGWLADILFNPANSQRFRENLFRLGYWFSVALPILFIPAIMISFTIRTPSNP